MDIMKINNELEVCFQMSERVFKLVTTQIYGIADPKDEYKTESISTVTELNRYEAKCLIAALEELIIESEIKEKK